MEWLRVTIPLSWTGSLIRRDEKGSVCVCVCVCSCTGRVGLAHSNPKPPRRSRNKGSYVLCLAAQTCPTLCNPMDCSPPGSLPMGILQARILEWVAMPSLQRIFPTQRQNPGLSRIVGGFFSVWTTKEALVSPYTRHRGGGVRAETQYLNSWHTWYESCPEFEDGH